MSKLNSIQTKIVLWTGICLLLVAAIIVSYAATSLRSAAIEEAENRAIAEARSHAAHIRAEIEVALDAGRTLAQALTAVKRAQDPITLDREQVNAMLKQVLENNANFLGTYTLWEPNAFDGLDEQYVNAEAHDETGRFIPYWVRGDDGKIHVEALLEYETEGIGNWYLFPKRTKKEHILDPFLYPIAGEDVLLTSLVTPIVVDGQFYGIAGVDLRIDFLQQLADEADVYDGSGRLVLLSNNGTLAGVTDQPELIGQPATDMGEHYADDLSHIQSGEEAIHYHKDELAVFVPIQFGHTETPWSVNVIIPTEKITAEATTAMWRMIGIGAFLAAFAMALLWFAAGRIARPVREITDVAQTVAGGNLEVEARVTSSDEVGVLAGAFNQMIARLSETVGSLRETADNLTERTRELEASQRVTFAASERTTPDELLGLVVDLVRDQFDLYHAQVYLVNEERQAAVLRQSTGYAGSQLLQKGHQIPLDAAALVTRAIHTGEPVLVDDVNQAEDWLPNPLLPETQSELAVPLKVGDRVIGVLDAQDMTPGRFTESTVALFQAMASQIAFLFENNELLERVTEQTETLTVFTTQLRTAAEIARQAGAVLDPESLLQRVVELMQSRFGLYHAHIYVLDEATGQLTVRAGSGEVGRVLRERGHAIPLGREKSLVARAARTQHPVLVEDTTLEPDFMPNPLLPQTRSELAVPLVAGGKTLGVLDMQDDQVERFTESDLDTYSTLAGQIATALQNAALFEQTETLYGISSDLNTASDEDEMLQALARPAVEAGCFQATMMYIDLDETGEPEWMEIAALWQREGTPAFPVGSRFYMPEFLLARLFMASPDEPQLIANLTTDERVDQDLENVMAQMGSRALATIPLTRAGRWVGVLNFIWTEPHEFSALEKEIYNSFVSLVAPAVASRQLLDEIQESEARFRDVALSTSDWVWETDAQGHYTYCSDKVIDVLGYTAEEMLGKTPFDLMAPQEAARVGEIFGEIAANKRPIVDLENWNVTKDGHTVCMLTDGVPLLDQEGNLIGYRGVDKDITERKQAEEALQESAARFRTLFDFAPEGVMVIDVDKLAFDDVNERALELFGYTRREMLKTSPLAVSAEVQPDGRSAMEVMSEAIQGAMAGGSPRLEALYVRSSGKEFPVDVQVVKLPEADRNLVRVSFSDITERKQAEEELRRLGSAVEQSIDGTAVADLDGNIQFINPAWAQMHGYSVEELQGKHLSMFHTKEQLQKDVGPFNERAMETGAHQGEVGHVRKDGTTFPTWMTTTLFKDERGAPVGLVGTARDITERKRAETERQRFTTQLRTAADLAERINAILDPDELLNEVVAQLQSNFDLYHVHVYLLDEAQRDLVMRSGSGEVGQKMLRQGHSIPLDREKSLVARAARGREIVSVADTTTAPDFMPNPLLPDTRSEVATPLVVGDRVLGVLDVQDSQTGRFTQADLNVLSTLAGQIAIALQNAGLFEQVQEAAEQVREADRRKSEFLADMSHELRTPLNSIIGYTELMLMGVSEVDPETLEDVQAIYDNGKHLLRIINDILDLAKIEAGRMELEMEKVHIPALLDEVKTSNAGLLVNKPVEILTEAEQDVPPIEADRVRLSQILNNLIGNAIKFTDEGRITMRAYVDRGRQGEKDGWVCIEVQDTGAGMSDDDLQKIFERFRRAGSSLTRRAEGTGLGLDITRHLVEMHGGTIDAHSNPGEGSTFTVRLPVRQVSEIRD